MLGVITAPTDRIPGATFATDNPLFAFGKCFLYKFMSASSFATALGSRFVIIVNEVRPVHPLKAESPISVTVSGSVIEVRPLQPLKALLPIFLSD